MQTTLVEARDAGVVVEIEQALEESHVMRSPARLSDRSKAVKQKRNRTPRESTEEKRDASFYVDNKEEASGTPKKQKSETSKQVTFGLARRLRDPSPRESPQDHLALESR
eukprot:g4433.t1